LQVYAGGCLRRTGSRWEPFRLNDPILEQPKYRPYVT
jgi:hypothetical protein